jgi:hypothetical protein
MTQNSLIDGRTVVHVPVLVANSYTPFFTVVPYSTLQ